LTPSQPHSSTCHEYTSTASERTPGSTGQTRGSAGPAKDRRDRSHEMSEHRSSPLQEHALAEVLNGLTGQLEKVVSHLDRQENVWNSLTNSYSSGNFSSESQRLKEKVPLGVRHLYATCKFMSVYYVCRLRFDVCAGCGSFKKKSREFSRL